MAAAASAQAAPPVAHAIGGSLGSAIALLMFYPLERARIEQQSEASRLVKKNALDFVEEDIDRFSENETGVMSLSSETKEATSSSQVSESSWISFPNKDETDNRADEKGKSDRNQSAFPINPALQATSPKAIATNTKKETLFECLLRLHQRKEMYTGVSPVVSTIFTSQFIFFYMHAVVKKLLKQSSRGGSKRTNTAVSSLISSCLAGLINVVLTNPLWVVSMAIITGETKTRNLWRELYVMIQKKGWYFMWSGTSASVLLVSNPVIQFFCYEQMKEARLTSLKKSLLPPIDAFFIGAMAKAIATVTT